MDNNLLIVTTTFDKKTDAEAMCKAMLKQRLIACGQISSEVTSYYWWKDEIEQSCEYLLQMKTHSGKYLELEKLICELHPYETPEIVAVEAKRVSAGYEKWLKKELS